LVSATLDANIDSMSQILVRDAHGKVVHKPFYMISVCGTANLFM